MKGIVMIGRSQIRLGLRCGGLAWLALLISGCAGMADIQGARDFMDSYSHGDYLAAVEVLGGERALAEPNQNLLTSLQVGTAFRAAGGFETSQVAFDRAESELLWKSDEITSVDDLLGAGFTLVATDLARPYQGTIYDGVLVNTFKALNALHLGDTGRARVELNRAEQRQTNAVEQLAIKARALGADTAEEAENREAQEQQIDGALAEAMKPDSPVGQRLAAVEALGEYGDLRNPFTDWLHGVFRLSTGDLNRASNLFRDAAVLEGRRNQFVLSDLLVAENSVGSVAGVPDRVWVIHEDGTGPYLDEFRFDFPVVTTDNVILASIALPEFVPGTPALESLVVTADGQDYRTEPLLDVDRYAATEFRAGYNAVVGKAIASTIIRTVLQSVIQNEARDQGGWASLFMDIGSRIAAEALTQADTRIWHSLPKSIDVASFPRPSDDRLVMTTSDGQTIYDDALPAGNFVLITVKSVRPGVYPAVHVATVGE